MNGLVTPYPVTYEANRIVHVKLAEASDVRHPLAAFGGRPGTRAVVHPITYPAMYLGTIRATTSLTDRWLVVDGPTGLPVPVIPFTFHAGRAVATHWNRSVARHFEGQPEGVDPTNLDAALEWGAKFVRRSPSEVALITEMQWPPYLPNSPYTSN